MRVRFKICCIASIDEAEVAIAGGADAIGLVSAMPSGPGVIADEAIARIARSVPPAVGSFLLTSRTDGPAIADQVVRSAVNTVQMVDEVPMSTYAHLRRTLPYVRLVQVLHVSSEEVLDQARGCLEHVDALLLDSGRPKAHIRELGGTGRTHDWALSRRIVEMSTKPVFLAGGLNAANARDAVRLVGPWGLDVCTGVRTDGRLDPLKLRAFADAL